MVENDAELRRLEQDAKRSHNWKRWGPYLPERQWGTVREDYSADGAAWDYFPHRDAPLRAYRWGEDGLLGWCDRECRLCFSVALWNGRDPILKERLFGLANEEGNHGEDCKELYYYLDATPTYSYAKALYKYPQAPFPYMALLAANAGRSRREPEYEILDTGLFDDNRYFDVFLEFAKTDCNDLLIRIRAVNRGPDTAVIHLLPTLWFRNTWAWGCEHEGCTLKPTIEGDGDHTVIARHPTLGTFSFQVSDGDAGGGPTLLFTENESASEQLWGTSTYTPYVKDAFHRRVVHGREGAVNPARRGTKAAAWCRLEIAPGESCTVCCRLREGERHTSPAFGPIFDATFERRQEEADAFYRRLQPASLSDDLRAVQRQAYAGLLWSTQFYHYSVRDWLRGDAGVMKPPDARLAGRNVAWTHLFNRDLISVPDKWEYPWYAAWDLAFHMIPFCRLDPVFTKQQLVLLLREWYMHPNGAIPAYEWALSDVNPPVHAWACWRVYKMSGDGEHRDRGFLERCFHKLLLNFTWWVNRKDPEGRNLFAGGFLGLDNIGVFDRSKPLPRGGRLAQADGTAWMGFYCLTMLAMALELARRNPVYEDVASKFIEHFVSIADAINSFGGAGLWDDEDGFYYDQFESHGRRQPLKVRSMVGLIPLLAVEVLHADDLERLPGFSKRLRWFVEHRGDLAECNAWLRESADATPHLLLALPSRPRLERVLRYLFDPEEFLSPYGIRSLSRCHAENPFRFRVDGTVHTVDYEPGEANAALFGGNSNWRGPVWFPVNFLLIEALERYHHFYGDTFRVEYPTGSGTQVSLLAAARDLERRLVALFLPGEGAQRPCHGADSRYAADPAFRDLLLFHEFFHGETGAGLGASHQTGWTALVAKLVEDL